jgi:hypothetical protein
MFHVQIFAKMITEQNSEVISDNSNVTLISDSRINHRNRSVKYVIIGFPRGNSVTYTEAFEG